MKIKAIIFAILLLAILLASCVTPYPDTIINYERLDANVGRFIDKEAGVVCWVSASYSGISCLPLSQTKLK